MNILVTYDDFYLASSTLFFLWLKYVWMSCILFDPKFKKVPLKTVFCFYRSDYKVFVTMDPVFVEVIHWLIYMALATSE